MKIIRPGQAAAFTVVDVDLHDVPGLKAFDFGLSHSAA
jgi:hypothetical protein